MKQVLKGNMRTSEMNRSQTVWTGLSVAVVLCCVLDAGAQQGSWSMARNDMGHAGVQKAERIMTRDKLKSEFKFLWRLKLGKEPTADSLSYTEPLLISSLITTRGFKDFVIWAGPQDVYAVDSELGTMLWTKHYDVAPSTCGASNLSTLIEP